MRVRYGGITLCLAVLLVVAGWIDWPNASAGAGQRVFDRVANADTVRSSLRECGSGDGSVNGEAVPERNIPSSERILSEIRPDDGLPRSTWSQRAGFSISSPTDPAHWAGMLGSGWYLDWNVKRSAEDNSPVHWQMVRVHEDCISPAVKVIQTAAKDFPGQVWIIGNEPDVIWQDNVTPEKYAAVYHDLYQIIKSADPTASVAVGGIAQATPLRVQYLDRVLQTYRDLYHEALPAEWWTVHGYVLREEKGSWGVEIPPGIDARQGEMREVSDHARIDLFEKQIIAFRQWMTAHGYQNTPLALTEFGIVMPSSYGFPPELVSNYLQQTFSWLATVGDETIGYPQDSYHLVQKWAWFSVADPTYSTSDLGEVTSGKLTLLGETFRNVIQDTIP